MKIFYSDTFELPLPDGHRFPMDKYRRLRQRLQSRPLDGAQFQLPDAATDEQLLRVHTRNYLDKLKLGTLTKIEERRIGFPMSPGLLERSRRSTGATINAAYAAVGDRAAVHLAGGTHHAFPDHGQGFCVFNDVAVACRALQSDGIVRKAVVVDLDVHQGNGTASVFRDDPSVFTFSMHGARNFPFSKCDGDLDVALADGTGDDQYLQQLAEVLENQIPLGDADMVLYLAGADPFEGDRFGRLKLTKAGLAERDRLVLEACRTSQTPLTVVMAGGYAQSIDDIVDIHTTTVQNVYKYWRRLADGLG